MLMGDWVVICGLLVGVYDKNNRIILPDTDYPIRFGGKNASISAHLKKRDVHT
jgi:hypothetical protein